MHGFFKGGIVALMLAACLMACSKRETAEPSKVIAASATTGESAAEQTSTAAASENVPAATAEESDLEKVGERTGAFQDMMASLRSYAGAEVEMNTNRVDIESFVKGKTERELLEFARTASQKSPYAAKQVAAYLLRNSTDPRIRIDAADLHTSFVPSLGDVEDRELALESFEMLKEYFADENLCASMTSKERQWLIAHMQNHVVDLILDSAAYYQMAQVIRQHAKTELEQSCADSYEAVSYIWGGKAGDIATVRSLYEQIRNRGAYDDLVLRKRSVDYWLEMSDAEMLAEANKLAEMVGVDKEAMDEWYKIQSLSPEERLKLMNKKRVGPII